MIVCVYIYIIYLEGNDICEHRLMSCSSTALCFLRSQSSVIGAPDSIFSATQSRGLGDCDMSNHHQFHGTRQVGRKKSSKSRSFAKCHVPFTMSRKFRSPNILRFVLGVPKKAIKSKPFELDCGETVEAKSHTTFWIDAVVVLNTPDQLQVAR